MKNASGYDDTIWLDLIKSISYIDYPAILDQLQG
jgi:hypothetical protein